MKHTKTVLVEADFLMTIKVSLPLLDGTPHLTEAQARDVARRELLKLSREDLLTQLEIMNVELSLSKPTPKVFGGLNKWGPGLED